MGISIFVPNPSESMRFDYHLCLNGATVMTSVEHVKQSNHLDACHIEFGHFFASSTAQFNFITLKEHPLYS